MKIAWHKNFISFEAIVFALLLSLLVVFTVTGTKNDTSENTVGDSSEEFGKAFISMEGLEEEEEIFLSLFFRENPDVAFRYVESLYVSDETFRSRCHGFMIKMGMSVQETSSDSDKLFLSPKSVVCNYGFYQSYSHHLLIASKNIEKVKRFCSNVGSSLRGVTPDASAECYRGIGKALPLLKETAIGNVSSMATFATKTCEEITNSLTGRERDFCLSGTFSTLARSSIKERDGLFINKKDPLWLCRIQPKRFQSYCYGNFKWAMVSLVKDDTDLDTAVALVTQPSKTPDEASKDNTLIWTLGYIHGRESASQTWIHKTMIEWCNGLPSPFDVVCISGSAVGVVKHGVPWKQHLAVFDFCEKVFQTMPSIQKHECLSAPIEYLQGFYNPELFKNMCAIARQRFKIFCEQT